MGNSVSIPIKNLFYMLCYAWNVLAIADDVKVSKDEYKDAYNLLAHVFSYGVGKLIKSGFHRSYIENQDELGVLRGKIQIKESLNKLSSQRKKLVCVYDEYSTNDLFNQILKYTIESLLKNANVDKSIKQVLKKQKLFFDGIDSIAPTKSNRQKLIFNRNNIMYKLLINLASMIYDNTMVNEKNGIHTFKDFYREKQMHKVFELFILNFYAAHLSKEEYKVHAPKINWHIESETTDMWEKYFDVDSNPGDRRTDIVIENRKANFQLIIDAKYYKKTFVDAYMNDDEERVRTTHLNQIRGYLIDSEFGGIKIGALFYPTTDRKLEREKIHPIKDAPIFVKTIDLCDDWENIEKDMLEFVMKIEEIVKTLMTDTKKE